MKINVIDFSKCSARTRAFAAGMMTIFLLEGATPAIAAKMGFSGKVVSANQSALMPERSDVVTFTNQVGIRFRSENTAAQPIKMKLSIHDSAGQLIQPVSISGSSIVQPKNQNLVTVVLPMENRGNEVFELCLQHVSKAKSVLRQTCSKLNVARLD